MSRRHSKIGSRFLPSSLVLAVLAAPAIAQTAPDSGQILQENRRPPTLPAPSPVPPIDMPRDAARIPLGGQQVLLQAVTVSGNKLFDAATLSGAVGEVKGKSFDLAGLRGLADKVANYYWIHGYPFTRTFIPPQDLKNGELQIQVLEGHYGKVVAESSDPWLSQGAQKFLAALQTGDAIESTELERAMLILGNQPGIKIRPLIRPGEATGAGDLTVNVERTARYTGMVGVDNTGSRYTGEYRLQAAVNANSQFLFGDRLTVRGILSDKSLWLGGADYELPLGGSGLRGQIGYLENHYALGGQFSSLDATGYAKVSTAKLSYSVVRSQVLNVLLSGGYQHKDLQDRYNATQTVVSKSSDALPIAVQFDVRDRFAGGGITYGLATWTGGNLNLNGVYAATDATTARTEGHFSKYTLDVARIQRLPADFALYGRFSGQWTTQNLDSSERFGLGGVYGVRAYPVGEGMGDKGWLGQVELRYLAGAFTPFVFYDAGSIQTNAKPWGTVTNNTRDIAGAGVGLRYEHQGWSVDSTLAWRTQGGDALSDTRQNNPRFWLMAAYAF